MDPLAVAGQLAWPEESFTATAPRENTSFKCTTAGGSKHTFVQIQASPLADRMEGCESGRGHLESIINLENRKSYDYTLTKYLSSLVFSKYL